MSSNNASGKVVTVDEQAFERTEDAGVDEDGFEVVDDQPEFRATVQQEKQAKVDSNHPDGSAATSCTSSRTTTLGSTTSWLSKT